MPEDQELARLSTGLTAGLTAPVLTVSQLNRSVRDVIEHRFPLLWVRGEISNCVAARSGHFYFALKDAQAQVRCVMFRSRAQALGWDPCDGTEVEVQGLVTLYEARGEFQLIVERMRRSGRGALYEAFLRLKDKLQAEGLFDETLKRPLPFLPRTVGVVTSPKAAALRDVLTTLARRNPSIAVVVYPALVQGEAAAPSLERALRRAAARSECDALLLCRGGGSIEDLWPFNDERVARAIRASSIPVVCGIGHETDFTIADFAADRRAPTPTAAAELVSPPRLELLGATAALLERLSLRLERDLGMKGQLLDDLARRLAHPARRLDDKALVLWQLRSRLVRAAAASLDDRRWRVSALLQRVHAVRPRADELGHQVQARLARMQAASRAFHERFDARLAALRSSLDHLSPQHVLERGFSVVRDAAGAVVGDAARLAAGDVIDITFASGSASARVERTRRDR